MRTIIIEGDHHITFAVSVNNFIFDKNIKDIKYSTYIINNKVTYSALIIIDEADLFTKYCEEGKS